MSNHSATRESEISLAELRGDCARMAPHWVVPAKSAPARIAPSLIHGVTVPAASARLIDAMSEYGD
ncbi:MULTISPECIES: hypothetical protein [unclassified Streptomyces]|uniref:hypothetical protein n=1 Tax=unclassified Streptomyces TaxID=2593676 RepID=UPI002257F905|nr:MULTISPECIES: hypothetical protein [unclassified Streptomyces]WSP54653.1 hypothetical protein OG306_09860 [Streptomyces sp. NBC_01241]WSU24670.1 hypothetical protein OG508_29480 [Streptomyces sp. NBC_01108]WTA35373.1 hypothetical protein OG936_08315 [Streptomyces sp. NBC_00846]MCX4786208.1 hypothetical protein [Streptomyces sp. NBC_01221]MCX4797935.1 hypothetical protein [Streptomyces sp. NBC_01242]